MSVRNVGGEVLHKESCRAHAARRFEERFGQPLTPKLRGWFHRQIERRTGAYLVAVHRDSEVYFVIDKGLSPEPIVVVFRRDWMEIITFMSPEFYRRQITGEFARERQLRRNA